MDFAGEDVEIDVIDARVPPSAYSIPFMATNGVMSFLPKPAQTTTAN